MDHWSSTVASSRTICPGSRNLAPTSQSGFSLKATTYLLSTDVAQACPERTIQALLATTQMSIKITGTSAKRKSPSIWLKLLLQWSRLSKKLKESAQRFSTWRTGLVAQSLQLAWTKLQQAELIKPLDTLSIRHNATCPTHSLLTFWSALTTPSTTEAVVCRETLLRETEDCRTKEVKALKARARALSATRLPTTMSFAQSSTTLLTETSTESSMDAWNNGKRRTGLNQTTAVSTAPGLLACKNASAK